MQHRFVELLTANTGPSIKRTISANKRVCYVSIALINKAKIFRSVPNSSPNHALIISLLPHISHVLRDMPEIAGILNLEGLSVPCRGSTLGCLHPTQFN